MDAELPGLAIALIVFQVVDALACVRPEPFIARGLDAIDCPPRIRRLLPFVKLDAAIGLALGLFEPIIGVLTCLALIAYFVVAIGFHVRARDTVARTVPAAVMLVVVTVVGLLSYVPAL